MNNQTLVIYDSKILYEIFKEIENHLNYNISYISRNKFHELKLDNKDNYLIISTKNNKSDKNQMLIDGFPLEIKKLIEQININFLKKKYYQQSEIDLGNYYLDLNSRKIFTKNKSLNLTERETNIIVFLKNSDKPVRISKLQKEVWGHNSKLETHTVETHIYRLRKKIKDAFGDDNLIKSSKLGYSFY